MQLTTLANLNLVTLQLEETETLINEAKAAAIINGADPSFYELLGSQQQMVCDQRQLVETLKFDIASRN